MLYFSPMLVNRKWEVFMIITEINYKICRTGSRKLSTDINKQVLQEMTFFKEKAVCTFTELGVIWHQIPNCPVPIRFDLNAKLTKQLLKRSCSGTEVTQ